MLRHEIVPPRQPLARDSGSRQVTEPRASASGIALVLLALMAAPLLQAEEGFTPLFDGKSLDGWTLVGKTEPGYIIQDGNLVCPEKGGGNLMSNKDYANFVLRFEVKMRADTNNGVGIRSPLNGHVSTLGMEIQIIDTSGPLYSKMK